MRYLAKSDPSKAKKPLFLFLLSGIICFFAAWITPYMKWIFDVGTVFSLSGIVYILIRYIFTSFEYETAEGNFIVYRQLGKNRELVFSIQKEMIEKIEKKSSFSKVSIKNQPQIHQFSPSFLENDPWVLVVRLRKGGLAWVYLQCSEEFGVYLQEWILEKEEQKE
jgi:hypothetical protein